MKKLIYLSALVFVVACATKKSTPVTTTPPSVPIPPSASSFSPTINVTEATFTTTVTDFSFADYQKGKGLYETKCIGCHELIPPSAKSTALWEKMVPVMVGKYNMKYSDFLDDTATKLISGYLVTVTTK